MQKKKLKDIHLKPPDNITRNAEGFAIIKVGNQNMICDDNIWNLFVNRKMHISFYGYVMVGKISLHRSILSCPDDLMIDHINR